MEDKNLKQCSECGQVHDPRRPKIFTRAGDLWSKLPDGTEEQLTFSGQLIAESDGLRRGTAE